MKYKETWYLSIQCYIYSAVNIETVDLFCSKHIPSLVEYAENYGSTVYAVMLVAKGSLWTWCVINTSANNMASFFGFSLSVLCSETLSVDSVLNKLNSQHLIVLPFASACLRTMVFIIRIHCITVTIVSTTNRLQGTLCWSFSDLTLRWSFPWAFACFRNTWSWSTRWKQSRCWRHRHVTLMKWLRYAWKLSVQCMAQLRTGSTNSLRLPKLHFNIFLPSLSLFLLVIPSQEIA